MFKYSHLHYIYRSSRLEVLFYRTSPMAASVEESKNVVSKKELQECFSAIPALSFLTLIIRMLSHNSSRTECVSHLTIRNNLASTFLFYLSFMSIACE